MTYSHCFSRKWEGWKGREEVAFVVSYDFTCPGIRRTLGGGKKMGTLLGLYDDSWAAIA